VVVLVRRSVGLVIRCNSTVCRVSTAGMRKPAFLPSASTTSDGQARFMWPLPASRHSAGR
jgi:hypothetical protein